MSNIKKPRAEDIQDGMWAIWDVIFPNLIEPSDAIQYGLGHDYFPPSSEQKKEIVNAIIFDKKFQDLIRTLDYDNPAPILRFCSRVMWFLDQGFKENSFACGNRLVRRTKIYMSMCETNGVFEGLNEDLEMVKQSCVNFSKTEKVNPKITSYLFWLREFAESDPLVLIMSCAEFIDKYIKAEKPTLLPVIGDWLLVSMKAQKFKKELILN